MGRVQADRGFGPAAVPERAERDALVLRAMPIADWLRVRLTPTGDADKGLQRAMRVEGRLNQRGMFSPSPSGGTLAGNEGALVAWAEAMTEEWSTTGYHTSGRSRTAGWA